MKYTKRSILLGNRMLCTVLCTLLPIIKRFYKFLQLRVPASANGVKMVFTMLCQESVRLKCVVALKNVKTALAVAA